MAATPPSASEVEGVEASEDATAELDCARRYAAERSPMGGLFQRLLAHGRLADTHSCSTQWPLAATRPARLQSQPASPLRNDLTNRRMRARMSGGVGGAGKPGPLPDFACLGRLPFSLAYIS